MTDYFKIAGEVLQQFRRGVSRLAKESSQPQVPEEVRTAVADPGNLFGKYVRVDLIGRGGGGEVYRAWDTKLGRWVAVKFPHLRTRDDRQRLLREANMAARLSHPNIVPLFEIVDEGDRPFIVLQFIDGQTLDRLRLKVPEALQAVRDMANAVAYAHGQGVIHRDLKPQNVMRGEDGRIYVLDFGLAKLAETGTSLTRTEHLLGTPAYMSPEQANGRRPDVRSDVYSIGTTLYELVTAQPPFVGNTAIEIIRRVQDEDPIAPRRLNPRLPRDVGTIIHKAMERDPRRRYRHALDFAGDIDRFLAGEPILAHPPSTLYRWHRRIVKHKALSSALVAILLLTFGFGAYAVYQTFQAAEDRDAAKKRELALMQLGALWNQVILANQGIYKPYMKPERIRLDLVNATRKVTEFINQHPEYPQGYYVRAKAKLYANDLMGAQNDLQHALAIDMDFAPGQALLGQVIFEIYAQKMRGHPKTLEVRRTRYAPMLTQARSMLAEASGKGFPSNSIEKWGLPSTSEDEVSAVLLRACAEVTSQSFSIGRQILLKANKENPSEYYCNWIGLIDSSRKEDAFWQSEALKIAPHFHRAHLARADARLEMGEMEEAISDYTRAIAFLPDYSDAYSNRSLARAELGDFEGAIRDCNKAIELDPNNSNAFNLRGNSKSMLAGC